jgi:hypothetical protein
MAWTVNAFPVIDDQGNLNLHAECGGPPIGLCAQDAVTGALQDISAWALQMEIAGQTPIPLTAGGDAYTQVITIPDDVVQSLSLSAPTPFVVRDVTASQSIPRWAGFIVLYGARIMTSGTIASGNPNPNIAVSQTGPLIVMVQVMGGPPGPAGSGGSATPVAPSSAPAPGSAWQVKTGACSVHAIDASSEGSPGWVLLLDAAETPDAGATVAPIKAYEIDAGASARWQYETPLTVSNGALLLFSSTGPTLFTPQAAAFLSGEAA